MDSKERERLQSGNTQTNYIITLYQLTRNSQAAQKHLETNTIS